MMNNCFISSTLHSFQFLKENFSWECSHFFSENKLQQLTKTFPCYFFYSYYDKYETYQQVLLEGSLLCAVTNVLVKNKLCLQTPSNVATYSCLYWMQGSNKLDFNPPGKMNLLNRRHNDFFQQQNLNLHGRMSSGSAGFHRANKPFQKKTSSTGKFSSTDLTVTKGHWQVSDSRGDEACKGTVSSIIFITMSKVGAEPSSKPFHVFLE